MCLNCYVIRVNWEKKKKTTFFTQLCSRDWIIMKSLTLWSEVNNDFVTHQQHVSKSHQGAKGLFLYLYACVDVCVGV